MINTDSAKQNMLLSLVTLSLSMLFARCTSTLTSYEDAIQNGVYNMSQPTETLFQMFKDTHERKYDSLSEEEKRRQIFADNIRYINKHNAKYAIKESTYYLGINQFTDMTYEEFAKQFANLQNEDIWTGNVSIFLPPENYPAPSSVDWRQKGYVTQVKDQGKCGSCWSFGVTGTIEGQLARQTGRLVPLSEQQLIDCSRRYGNKGCKGGYTGRTLQYVSDQPGIEGEADYPYRAGDSYPCSFTKSKVRAIIRGYYTVNPGEKNLEIVTASVGPISVSMYVNRNFQHYHGGIFYDPSCAKTSIGRHAVLVVGFGSSPSNYWLVKNSWSYMWGEAGYIRMAKNRNNICGIASKAVFPRM
ncbi:procathepsin L-like isoform X2 [Dreissena polymorpha]|uniref:procathepsin L-like isoform X2 n=1 Tax=Dreissena polymorpha TaxID=45954 RepID=UPI0022653C79|nr:procathepsin L-like isoform X2 [Dreissena polymorpha]